MGGRKPTDADALDVEIERLRGLNQALREECEWLREYREDAKAEIDRLRAALSWLEDMEPVLVEEARERFLVLSEGAKRDGDAVGG